MLVSRARPFTDRAIKEGISPRSQTLYLTATLGKGHVALVHSTSSIPSRSQGEVAVPVVVGLRQPLNQLFFTVPRLTRMYYINRGIGR